MRDGNQCLFPLIHNSTQAFVDPRWIDLVPLQSVAAHTESLAMLGGGGNSKSKITIVAVALQVRLYSCYGVLYCDTSLQSHRCLQGCELMRHIMRCDVSAVRCLLANVSQELNNIRRQEMIQEIVSQMADGGRNILHICAAMCIPTTNKEVDEITANSLGAALDAYSMTRRAEEMDRGRG